MNIPYIFNIQKYSIHDGPGVRTTIFFKGCALSCWWCHNPESQHFTPELMMNFEKCTGCGSCSKHCSQNAITINEENHLAITDFDKCVRCWDCIDFCINNNREVAGKQYSVKELINIIDKDKQFYEESSGGVTLSGGEVMAQDIDYLEKLCQAIKNRGYNLVIDTCGYAPNENYIRLAKYVDTFLYDIKVIDDELHKKYIGQSNKLILKNLETINELNKDINIRIPLVEPVNCSDEQIDLIINYLKDKKITVSKVNLLPYHNTGSSKYERLSREYLAKNCSAPSDEVLKKIVKKFEANGYNNVKIGG